MRPATKNPSATNTPPKRPRRAAAAPAAPPEPVYPNLFEHVLVWDDNRVNVAYGLEVELSKIKSGGLDKPLPEDVGKLACTSYLNGEKARVVKVRSGYVVWHTDSLSLYYSVVNSGNTWKAVSKLNSGEWCVVTETGFKPIQRENVMYLG